MTGTWTTVFFYLLPRSPKLKAGHNFFYPGKRGLMLQVTDFTKNTRKQGGPKGKKHD
jgi:hypothetical protein